LLLAATSSSEKNRTQNTAQTPRQQALLTFFSFASPQPCAPQQLYVRLPRFVSLSQTSVSRSRLPEQDRTRTLCCVCDNRKVEFTLESDPKKKIGYWKIHDKIRRSRNRKKKISWRQQ
jgi:peroxiredoxin